MNLTIGLLINFEATTSQKGLHRIVDDPPSSVRLPPEHSLIVFLTLAATCQEISYNPTRYRLSCQANAEDGRENYDGRRRKHHVDAVAQSRQLCFDRAREIIAVRGCGDRRSGAVHSYQRTGIARQRVLLVLHAVRQYLASCLRRHVCEPSGTAGSSLAANCANRGDLHPSRDPASCIRGRSAAPSISYDHQGQHCRFNAFLFRRSLYRFAYQRTVSLLLGVLSAVRPARRCIRRLFWRCHGVCGAALLDRIPSEHERTTQEEVQRTSYRVQHRLSRLCGLPSCLRRAALSVRLHPHVPFYA